MMTPVETAIDLVAALRTSQLLPSHQLDELSRDLPGQYPNARALARVLLERGWLTPFQLNLLLQGQGSKLVLGPYVILERVGDNVLGQVLKARHHFMNRLVTLTIVREELLSQPQTVEQFYKEIQAASQLSDPHIVHAYDAGPIGATHFFAMEYVEGTDLETLVQQLGRLSASTACWYIRQAAQGLQHAYDRRLLHHDLRPANLIVAKVSAPGPLISITAKTPIPSLEQLREASLKICNLGLTLLQPRLRKVAAPGTESTIDYIAPEQAQGSQPLDVRSNMYSLGCIFYFMLTGRAPFAGSNSSVKLKQHQLDEPPPIETYRRDVQPRIRDIVMTLLAKNPDDRYQTPGELVDALSAGPWSSPSIALPASSGTSSGIQPKPPLPGRKLPVPDWLLPFRGMKLAVRVGLLAGVLVAGLLFLVLALLLLRGALAPTESRPTVDSRPPLLPLPQYVKKSTRIDTILASLQASGLPTFEGKWYAIGPFDNAGGKGFDTVYPPETEIALDKSYSGKDKLTVRWKEVPGLRPGVFFDIKSIMPRDSHAVVYFYHEFETPHASELQVGFGSDDTITVWFNGQRLISRNVQRGVAEDQEVETLVTKPGTNRLLVKICQGDGDWKFWIMPHWPENMRVFESNLTRDFPARKQ